MILVSTSQAQGRGVATIIEPESILEVPSPGIVHGAGFARLSSFNPSRSFAEAKRNAFIDLEASILTSVYLEYYGTDGTQSRLKSEFGISDSLEISEIAVVDSAVVGDWAVFFIKDADHTGSFPSQIISTANNANWTYEFFEPRIMDGYWISSGMNEQTRFNPGRGWTKAKQRALQNLSEYLNTSVQSLQRTYDDELDTVHYVTSKHVFSNIGVIGRRMVDSKYHVLIMVNEQDIVRIDAN